MTHREQLWKLIIDLLSNKYDIHDFCDEFSRIYNLEIDYDTLGPQERCEFNDLCDIADRFSDNEQELAIPNVYFSEQQIRIRAQEIFDKLPH